MTIELRAFARDLVTFVATFDQPFETTWQDAEFDVGAGEFVIPHDSPQLQLTPSMVQRGTLVKVNIDGTDRFGLLIDRRLRERGESWDRLQLVSLGLESILGRAVTYMYGGLAGPPNDTRWFAWIGADYLMRDSWTAPPTSLGQYANPTHPDLNPDPEAPAVNAVQRIRVDAEPPPWPWGSTYPSPGGLPGYWRLWFEGRWTAPINWDVYQSGTQGRAEIKSALEALPNIDGVTVTGSDPWDVTFDTGNVAGRSVQLMQMDHSTLRHTHFTWHVREQTSGSREVEGERIIPDWPDPLAEWFGVFGQRRWYRRVIDVEQRPAAQRPIRMYVAGLSDYEVWFDGQSLGRGAPFSMSSWDFELLSTQHVWAIESDGPVIGTIVRMRPDGTVGDSLYRTFTPAVAGHSGSPYPWYEHGPDEPHGVTPGFLLSTLFDEAQSLDRLVLTPLTRSFDWDLTSSGDAWTEDVDLELGVIVGNDTLLDVLARLSDLDIWGTVDPDLNFHVWHGPREDRTATVTVGIGDVYELVAETEDEVIDSFLIRWERGWTNRHVTTGELRHEGFLSFGTIPSASTARRMAREELRRFMEARILYSWMTAESMGGAKPMEDYFVGDVITGPTLDGHEVTAEWTNGPVRLVTLQAQLSDTGDVEWLHEAIPA